MTVRCRCLVVVSVLLLAACSRGQLIPQTAAPGEARALVPSHTLSATIVVRIPNAMVGEAVFPGLMHQAFVAASTRGALLQLYNHDKDKHPIATIAANLSPKSKICKKTSSGRACSIVVGVPSAATYDFVIDTYDKPPKHGKFSAQAKQLAVGMMSEKVTKSRTIKLILGGIVASTQTAFAKTSAPAIDPLSAPVTVAARDADGNVIVTDQYVDKHGKPVTLTMSAGSGAGTTIAFTPASFDKPTSVTLNYTPAAMSSTQAKSGFTATLVADANNGAPPNGPAVALTAPKVTLFSIPTGGSQPQYITAGPDGALWFTEYNPNQIGRITTAGVVTNEFSAGSSGTGPRKIISGPDGNLWFTAQTGNSISKMDTAGNVSPFVIPTLNSDPEGLAFGSDGNVWFTEEGTNRIGRLNTALTGFVETSLGGASKPYAITSGAAGALWFTDFQSNQIDRITTSASVMATPFSTGAAAGPYAIAYGSDGALWFIGCNAYIARMTTAGVLTKYTIPNGSGSDVTVGPDGATWFTVITSGSTVQSIGRITSSGMMTLYPIETTPSNPYPTGIAKGPDGAIWFLEFNSNKVGRLQ